MPCTNYIWDSRRNIASKTIEDNRLYLSTLENEMLVDNSMKQHPPSSERSIFFV